MQDEVQTRKRWAFLTFGGDSLRWRLAAWRLAREARKTGLFEVVYRYTDLRLRSDFPAFWDEHGSFIRQHPKGFGFWIWKPFLIRAILNQSNDNIDGVFYLDAGFEINHTFEAIKRLQEYLQLADANSFFGMKLDVSLASWCKDDALIYYGLEEAERTFPIVISGLVAIANNPLGRAIADDWWRGAQTEGSSLLTDDTGECPVNKDFIDHRHDQSLLSCVVAKYDLYSIPDETYFPLNWLEDGHTFPCWALRNSLPISVKPGTIGGLFRRIL
jgi:hypothetical protein